MFPTRSSDVAVLPNHESLLCARYGSRGGTIFVTTEDETGDAQVILWPDVYARYKRELGSQVELIRGELSRYDGTANVIMSSRQRYGRCALV